MQAAAAKLVQEAAKGQADADMSTQKAGQLTAQQLTTRPLEQVSAASIDHGEESEANPMPVKRLQFFDEEDSLPAIQDEEDDEDEDEEQEEEEEAEDQGALDSGTHDAADDGNSNSIVAQLNQPTIPQLLGGGAVRTLTDVKTNQRETQEQRRLSGGARRVSRRVSVAPTLENVGLFDEAEDSVLDSTACVHCLDHPLLFQNICGAIPTKLVSMDKHAYL